MAEDPRLLKLKKALHVAVDTQKQLVGELKTQQGKVDIAEEQVKSAEARITFLASKVAYFMAFLKDADPDVFAVAEYALGSITGHGRPQSTSINPIDVEGSVLTLEQQRHVSEARNQAANEADTFTASSPAKSSSSKRRSESVSSTGSGGSDVKPVKVKTSNAKRRSVAARALSNLDTNAVFNKCYESIVLTKEQCTTLLRTAKQGRRKGGGGGHRASPMSLTEQRMRSQSIFEPPKDGGSLSRQGSMHIQRQGLKNESRFHRPAWAAGSFRRDVSGIPNPDGDDDQHDTSPITLTGAGVRNSFRRQHPSTVRFDDSLNAGSEAGGTSSGDETSGTRKSAPRGSVAADGKSPDAMSISTMGESAVNVALEANKGRKGRVFASQSVVGGSSFLGKPEDGPDSEAYGPKLVSPTAASSRTKGTRKFNHVAPDAKKAELAVMVQKLRDENFELKSWAQDSIRREAEMRQQLNRVVVNQLCRLGSQGGSVRTFRQDHGGVVGSGEEVNLMKSIGVGDGTDMAMSSPHVPASSPGAVYAASGLEGHGSGWTAIASSSSVTACGSGQPLSSNFVLTSCPTTASQLLEGGTAPETLASLLQQLVENGSLHCPACGFSLRHAQATSSSTPNMQASPTQLLPVPPPSSTSTAIFPALGGSALKGTFIQKTTHSVSNSNTSVKGGATPRDPSRMVVGAAAMTPSSPSGSRARSPAKTARVGRTPTPLSAPALGQLQHPVTPRAPPSSQSRRAYAHLSTSTAAESNITPSETGDGFRLAMSYFCNDMTNVIQETAAKSAEMSKKLETCITDMTTICVMLFKKLQEERASSLKSKQQVLATLKKGGVPSAAMRSSSTMAKPKSITSISSPLPDKPARNASPPQGGDADTSRSPLITEDDVNLPPHHTLSFTARPTTMDTDPELRDTVHTSPLVQIVNPVPSFVDDTPPVHNGSILRSGSTAATDSTGGWERPTPFPVHTAAGGAKFASALGEDGDDGETRVVRLQSLFMQQLDTCEDRNAFERTMVSSKETDVYEAERAFPFLNVAHKDDTASTLFFAQLAGMKTFLASTEFPPEFLSSPIVKQLMLQDAKWRPELDLLQDSYKCVASFCEAHVERQYLQLGRYRQAELHLKEFEKRVKQRLQLLEEMMLC